VINARSDLKGCLEYVDYIVSLLREHGAAEEYVAKLKAVAITANPAIASQIEALQIATLP
jgi:hypothetical protein